MKRVSILPNLITLANAGCGILAISKAIDALVAPTPELFDAKLETACWLIGLAMVFDALDGKVARLVDGFSDFGAQLDSFADAITFGVAPAILAKVLLEHADVLHPRMHFLVAASFALMAILRLARFNAEAAEGEHSVYFKGLPSPAAALTLTATILMYLSLGGTIEVAGGDPTPLGKGLEYLPQSLRNGLAVFLLPMIVVALPALGLLMVSKVRYAHVLALLFKRQGGFQNLVAFVFLALGLYLAPVPLLFAGGVFYVSHGVVVSRLRKRSSEADDDDPARAA